MKSKFNKEINDKLNDLFIFTKDNNDMIKYNEILNLVDLDISTHKLKYHLKYNYCMSKQVGGKSGCYLVYVYTGLKFRNNH